MSAVDSAHSSLLAGVAHTPGPWRTSSTSPCIIKQDSGCDDVLGESRLPIGSMFSPEDAAYVVKCVNAHDALLAAAECSLALEIDADEGRAILERHGFVWADRLTKPATGFVAGLCRAAIARATGAAA